MKGIPLVAILFSSAVASVPALAQTPDQGMTLGQVKTIAGDGSEEEQIARLIPYIRLEFRARGVDDELLTAFRLKAEARRRLSALGAFRGITPLAPEPAPDRSEVAKAIVATFQIRKSLLDSAGLDKPATFSFSTFDRSDAALPEGNDRTQISAKAAVIGELTWLTVGDGRLSAVPLFGGELDVTTGLTKDADRITVRVGAKVSLVPEEEGWVNTVVAAYDLSSDRGFDADVRAWSVQYSVVQQKRVDGVLTDSVWLGEGITFKWRPSAGYQWQKVHETAGIPALADLKDTNQWFAMTELEFDFGRIAVKPMGMVGQRRGDRVTTFVLGEVVTSLDLASPSSSVKVGVDLEWAVGHRYPKFLREQRGKIALSVKF